MNAWVKKAIANGRKVPAWIANVKTEKEFDELMALRENAFPATKPTGIKSFNPNKPYRPSINDHLKLLGGKQSKRGR